MSEEKKSETTKSVFTIKNTVIVTVALVVFTAIGYLIYCVMKMRAKIAEIKERSDLHENTIYQLVNQRQRHVERVSDQHEKQTPRSRDRQRKTQEQSNEFSKKSQVSVPESKYQEVDEYDDQATLSDLDSELVSELMDLEDNDSISITIASADPDSGAESHVFLQPVMEKQVFQPQVAEMKNPPLALSKEEETVHPNTPKMRTNILSSVFSQSFHPSRESSVKIEVVPDDFSPSYGELVIPETVVSEDIDTHSNISFSDVAQHLMPDLKK
jgi:hypothetical protein